ncbi:MAG: glycosyltransferase [Candidatus Methylomirabilia bacterium]
MGPLVLPLAVAGYHVAVIATSCYQLMRSLSRRRSAPFLEKDARDPVSPPDQTLSIVIPARNEERTLGPCLRGAASQRVRRLEIVVVDDGSEDRTLAVAEAKAREDPRIAALRAGPLPGGWVGKCHALETGARASAGEWLLFIDADVILAPEAAETALRFAAARSVDLLSLSPSQSCVGFWERLLQPLVFDLLDRTYDLRVVNDPGSPMAAANGQFLMVRRDAYDRIGGHAGVRGEVLEDVGLARRAKGAGLRLYFANTRSLARARMYGSLREIWKGWSKNLFPLLGANDAELLGTVLGEVFLWIVPVVTVGIALGLGNPADPVWSLAWLSGFVAILSLVGAATPRLTASGVFPGYAVLVSLGKLVLLAMMADSWIRYRVGRGVVWKGRRYPAEQS